jgi:hypothetical protein
MYSKPPVDFTELFAPFSDDIKTIGEKLRDIILRSTPSIEEHIYGGKKIGNALYSVGEKNNVICGLQPHNNFIRVFFHNWKMLKEAGYSIDGSGKNARHIKVETISSLNNIDLISMIEIVKR